MNAPDWRNLAVLRNDLLNIHPLLSVFPHLGFTQFTQWKDYPVRTSDLGRNSLLAQLGELLVFYSRNWCSRWLLSPLFGQEWRCNATDGRRHLPRRKKEPRRPMLTSLSGLIQPTTSSLQTPSWVRKLLPGLFGSLHLNILLYQSKHIIH